MLVQGGRIAHIRGGPAVDPTAYEFGEATILPGLVDMHTHFGINHRAGDVRAQMAGPAVRHILAGCRSDDGHRLWLVDWEYAGFNSPLFDLGGLASNSELSPEQAKRTLGLYFGKPVDDELRRRAAAMTAASLLRETMWSMVSEIHSTVDFDYTAYTAENLRRFESAYATYLTMDRA